MSWLLSDPSSSGISFDAPSTASTVARGLPLGVKTNIRWTVTRGGCSLSDDAEVYNHQVTTSAPAQGVCETTADCSESLGLKCSPGNICKIGLGNSCEFSPTRPCVGVYSFELTFITMNLIFNLIKYAYAAKLMGFFGP